MIGAFWCGFLQRPFSKLQKMKGGKTSCFGTASCHRNTFSNFILELIGNLCIGICRILPGSVFSTEVTGDAKNRIRLYIEHYLLLLSFCNWFSIRWNHWIQINPQRGFRTKLCTLFFPKRQRLGICMDSCYCTINEAQY